MTTMTSIRDVEAEEEDHLVHTDHPPWTGRRGTVHHRVDDRQIEAVIGAEAGAEGVVEAVVEVDLGRARIPGRGVGHHDEARRARRSAGRYQEHLHDVEVEVEASTVETYHRVEAEGVVAVVEVVVARAEEVPATAPTAVSALETAAGVEIVDEDHNL